MTNKMVQSYFINSPGSAGAELKNSFVTHLYDCSHV